MHHPIRADDECARLLDAYVSSGKSEAAFVEIVERLGGLVYSSALRRTGNAQMAEEVMQNVFAILARKASSLEAHPALTAWLFETTRLEAAQAMRTERRQRRKRQALAAETEADSAMGGAEAEDWRDAVPLLDESLDRLSRRERQLILQRFFEERKIREIAALSGISEAACKMRLKRTLTKLAQQLTARGVTLSLATVASALCAELTRAAPARVVATTGPKALAASGGLSTGILFANTLLTMNLSKPIVIGAALVAAATAPILWHQIERPNERASNAALDPLTATSGLLDAQGDHASDKIRKLEEEIAQLRNLNQELEKVQAEWEDEKRVEEHGLDFDYINTLKHKNLSENLIVSAEGQIKYGLQKDQVREINQSMRAYREMVQQYEKDHTTLEASTDDHIVLKIPAFPEEERFRDQVLEKLTAILGSEKGNRFFTDAQLELSRALMGFGSHDRTVTISNLQEPIVNIQDKQFDDSGNPFTSSWNTPLEEIPVQYRHIMQLADE